MGWEGGDGYGFAVTRVSPSVHPTATGCRNSDVTERKRQQAGVKLQTPLGVLPGYARYFCNNRLQERWPDGLIRGAGGTGARRLVREAPTMASWPHGRRTARFGGHEAMRP
ncbi:hypothetical protein GCM10010140_32530 [Streptosporangium pseudovulgare]|uniref:G-patch domain-containing protein n=1 Tax=Streptosporangium pseudovulgare TaxID=35765 RepID=A0ABQ2QY89_9ACTN|nr:hypothetical protein GCM10010140_32530 [Streptosporangium pseudovulgare]